MQYLSSFQCLWLWSAAEESQTQTNSWNVNFQIIFNLMMQETSLECKLAFLLAQLAAAVRGLFWTLPILTESVVFRSVVQMWKIATDVLAFAVFSSGWNVRATLTELLYNRLCLSARPPVDLFIRTVNPSARSPFSMTSFGTGAFLNTFARQLLIGGSRRIMSPIRTGCCCLPKDQIHYVTQTHCKQFTKKMSGNMLHLDNSLFIPVHTRIKTASSLKILAEDLYRYIMHGRQSHCSHQWKSYTST